ncbi:MAG: DUF3179 domain-containing (seleno)protein, partial [Planctomycetota bacterium]
DARAIAGPAAGERLPLLPFSLETWSEWLARHPDTTTLDPRGPYRRRQYKSDPYGKFQSDDRRIEYSGAVNPLPPEDGLPWKTTVLVVEAAGETRAYPLPLLADHAGEAATCEFDHAGQALPFRVRRDPLRAVLVDPPPGTTTRYAYWYAWHAMHPGDHGLVE